MQRFPSLTLIGLTLLVGLGCASHSTTRAAPPPAKTYVPGLGDFMTAYVQPHHIKLWLAGSHGDWPLAAYETSELRETVDDVRRYTPTWKGAPIAQLVQGTVKPALKQVAKAIQTKNPAAFKVAYASLTESCDACHQAAHHPFIVIKVPEANAFSDQVFGAGGPPVGPAGRIVKASP